MPKNSTKNWIRLKRVIQVLIVDLFDGNFPIISTLPLAAHAGDLPRLSTANAPHTWLSCCSPHQLHRHQPEVSKTGNGSVKLHAHAKTVMLVFMGSSPRLDSLERSFQPVTAWRLLTPSKTASPVGTYLLKLDVDDDSKNKRQRFFGWDRTGEC